MAWSVFCGGFDCRKEVNCLLIAQIASWVQTHSTHSSHRTEKGNREVNNSQKIFTVKKLGKKHVYDKEDRGIADVFAAKNIIKSNKRINKIIEFNTKQVCTNQ